MNDAKAPMADAGPTIRVLLVEDVAADAELIIDQLHDDGFECATRCVDTEPAFVAALDEFKPDIVLSDLHLPAFDGYRALDMLRHRDVRTPFLFVSGTMGEDVAVEALHQGATDYILKSSPARLTSAVRRAVREAAEQRARQRAEDELIRAQRFESLALLAGGLSHDLRNLLQPLLLAADSLDEMAADPRLARLAALVRDCGQRGLDMVSSMLTFARGARRSERVEVDALLQALRLLLQGTVPGNVTLEVDAQPAGLGFEGNSTELQQCLLNLCLNAIQAMPDGGRLCVSARRGQLAASDIRRGEKMAPGPCVCLRVADSGIGMPAAVLDHLFQPFFTTKDDGTGLGLVSCRRIIESHGGLMRVDSTPGAGTAFELYLPAARQGENAAAGEPAPHGQGERILVVEEEAVHLSLLTSVLDSSGYDTHASQGGADAVQSLAADGLPQLVVLDADMNLMTGVRTIAALLDRDYCGAVLLLTRPDARPDPDELPPVEHLGMLDKPIEVDALLRAVRDALGAVAPSS